MRRLLPEPADDVSVADAYRAPLGDHSTRPWVSLCMVTSLDGSTVVGGTSGRLSSPTDVAVLAQLRSIADVIVVGAGTVRDEGYGPPRKSGQRIGVVTSSGRLDLRTPLFESGAGFVITTEDAAVDAGAVEVIRAGTRTVNLSAAIGRLTDLVTDCRVVQAEGGPTLNGALLDADLIDELNLTTSPGLVGGSGPRLVSGAGDHQMRFDVAQLAIDDEAFVYARWLRRQR
jgi:riboflavin biosynthesis pyrimidine reductase